MVHSKIPFEQISALSHKDVFYQLHADQLQDFYQFSPDKHGLSEAIKHRWQHKVDRTLVYEVLIEHYQNGTTSEKQAENIKNLLSEDCFTITTAHQPCLLGGPAYYFYKICSTIHLCRSLKASHTDLDFVPIFVNGSEDHDFDEVKSIFLFGKSVEWQHQPGGSVGRFTTEGLLEACQVVAEILGNSPIAIELMDKIFSSLRQAKTYNEFVFLWLNSLFRDYGLLVLNMDDVRLKRAFLPILKKEIFQRISAPIVQKTQEALLEKAFKPQAFARDINVFYLTQNGRERIYFEDGQYHINNTEYVYSEKEMSQHVENHPENFSPNVVLRPLYQEYILPNIAYIGGGGEIAYWLERKKQFEAFGVFFPTLIRRNSVLLISPTIQKSIEKLGLNALDFLQEEATLITQYLQQQTEANFSLDTEISSIETLFEGVAHKAKAIDPTLEAFVMGESSKTVKAIENIAARLKRSAKQKEEVHVQQLQNIKSKLFPSNGLQERKDSFLQFWVSDAQLLDKMIDVLNPLDKHFLFIFL